MPEISTPRLTLRRFTEADLTDYLTYQTLPEVRAYLPDEAMTPEKALAFFAQQATLKEDSEDCYHAFAVVHVADSKVIGDVGLYRPSGKEKSGDLGFQFHPSYHGQGYALEAASALIGYAFENWNLQRITSGCDARNEPSFRLMERLGLRREAHFRQSQVTKGFRHDEYIYAILRDEWKVPE